MRGLVIAAILTVLIVVATIVGLRRGLGSGESTVDADRDHAADAPITGSTANDGVDNQGPTGSIAKQTRPAPTAAASPGQRPSAEEATADNAHADASPPAHDLSEAELAHLREIHAMQLEEFDKALDGWLTPNPRGHDSLPRAGPIEPPGLPLPVRPADPGSVAVTWDRWATTIDVADGPVVDGKRRARVTTMNQDGKVLVAYDALAYHDAAGNLLVDGRGAEVTGPWSRMWSPDSFTITPDHQVTTIDDLHRERDGASSPADGG